MRFDYGYEEETAGHRPYRLKVLGRLVPFLKPYFGMLVASSALVLLITGVELAMPYFTKVVVDRFIVPVRSEQGLPSVAGPADGKTLVLDLQRAEVKSVVERHRGLFLVSGDQATINYRDLWSLSPDELEVVRRSDMQALFGLVLVFLVFVAADFGLNFGQRFLMEYTGHRVMHDLRSRLYRHIQHLPMEMFNRNPVARLVTRVTNDVQNMHELLTSVLSMFFKDIVLLAGIVVLLMVLDRHLALVSLAVLPVVALAAFGFSNRMRDVFRRLRIKVAEINTRFAETVAGIKVIQAYGRQGANQQFFQDLNRSYFRLGMQQIHVLALFLPAIEMVGVTVTAMLVYFGGTRVISGSLSLGELVAFLAYMKIFFRPIRDLADKYNIFQNAMASAERIIHLMNQKTDDTQPFPKTGIRGRKGRRAVFNSLDVCQVHFCYNDQEPVLNGVSLSLRAGQTIALVGPTGAGKSTLVNLLLGFYKPRTGKILINGIPLQRWERSKLQAMLGWVPQESLFFSGTLKDNIFDPQADWSRSEMDAIISMAGCRELVESLPQGLDTVLAEGAANLSAGQRQLVAVARALARRPELIIMDEATAHIDSQTELLIQKAMAAVSAGRTCILVAHRLSTARLADRIYVVNQGQIVEEGTHLSLLASGGLYSRLWRLQQN